MMMNRMMIEMLNDVRIQIQVDNLIRLNPDILVENYAWVDKGLNDLYINDNNLTNYDLYNLYNKTLKPCPLVWADYREQANHELLEENKENIARTLETILEEEEEDRGTRRATQEGGPTAFGAYWNDALSEQTKEKYIEKYMNKYMDEFYIEDEDEDQDKYMDEYYDDDLQNIPLLIKCDDEWDNNTALTDDTNHSDHLTNFI